MIAVIGAFPGAGATHLSLALANYLTNVEGLRACYSELGIPKHGSVRKMIGESAEVCGRTVSFTTGGLTCYLQTDEDSLRKMRQTSGDCMIVDVQNPYEETALRDRFGFDRILIVGSACPWRYHDFQLLIRHAYEQVPDVLKGKFYGTCAGEQEIRRFEKEFEKPLHPLPPIRDPLHLTREDLRFLETVLW